MLLWPFLLLACALTRGEMGRAREGRPGAFTWEEGRLQVEYRWEEEAGAGRGAEDLSFDLDLSPEEGRGWEIGVLRRRLWGEEEGRRYRLAARWSHSPRPGERVGVKGRGEWSVLAAGGSGGQLLEVSAEFGQKFAAPGTGLTVGAAGEGEWLGDGSWRRRDVGWYAELTYDHLTAEPSLFWLDEGVLFRWPEGLAESTWLFGWPEEPGEEESQGLLPPRSLPGWDSFLTGRTRITVKKASSGREYPLKPEQNSVYDLMEVKADHPLPGGKAEGEGAAELKLVCRQYSRTYPAAQASTYHVQEGSAALSWGARKKWSAKLAVGLKTGRWWFDAARDYNQWSLSAEGGYALAPGGHLLWSCYTRWEAYPAAPERDCQAQGLNQELHWGPDPERGLLLHLGLERGAAWGGGAGPEVWTLRSGVRWKDRLPWHGGGWEAGYSWEEARADQGLPEVQRRWKIGLTQRF
ncbi:MAG: hypothetical protein QJR13_00375 [Bacillota bacterium]|nr:hypothetical protein [Bacillota bacterium]